MGGLVSPGCVGEDVVGLVDGVIVDGLVDGVSEGDFVGVSEGFIEG